MMSRFSCVYKKIHTPVFPMKTYVFMQWFPVVTTRSCATNEDQNESCLWLFLAFVSYANTVCPAAFGDARSFDLYAKIVVPSLY